MAAICEYQHKKFNLKSEEHSNKKICLPVKKRKLIDMEEDKENVITAQSILEKAQKDIHPEQPLAKRRQTKPLFRPWLDEDSNKPKKSAESGKNNVVAPKVLSTISANVVQQHATKSLKEKEQQRRYHNSLAYLINRRNEQKMLQQQYMAQQQLQVAMMNQSVTTAIYLRHLQQMALQRQQQLFVFGTHY